MLWQKLSGKAKIIIIGVIALLVMGLGYGLGHRNPTVITQEKQVEVQVHDLMDVKQKETYESQIVQLKQRIIELQIKESSLHKKTIKKPDGTVIEVVDKDIKTTNQSVANVDTQKANTSATKEKEIQIVHDVVYKEKIVIKEPSNRFFIGAEGGTFIQNPKDWVLAGFAGVKVAGPLSIMVLDDFRNPKNVAFLATVLWSF